MTWKKGQSGNPNGRPKVAVEVRDLARRKGPEAFDRIVELAKSDDERVSLAACQEILNRAYGKPSQSVNVKSTRQIVDLTDGEIVAFLVEEGAGEGAANAPDGQEQLPGVH